MNNYLLTCDYEEFWYDNVIEALEAFLNADGYAILGDWTNSESPKVIDWKEL